MPTAWYIRLRVLRWSIATIAKVAWLVAMPRETGLGGDACHVVISSHGPCMGCRRSWTGLGVPGSELGARPVSGAVSDSVGDCCHRWRKAAMPSAIAACAANMVAPNAPACERSREPHVRQ